MAELTAPTPRLEERRVAIRYPSAGELTCSPLPEGEEERWTARVVDISETGVGLLVDREIEPETLLEVRMAGEDAALTYPFLVHVVHARPREEGEWLLGCAFARPLSRGEMRVLR